MSKQSHSQGRESGSSQLPVQLFSSTLSWKLHDLAKAKYFYAWFLALAIYPVVAAIIVTRTSTWSSLITRFVVFFSAFLVFGTLPFACQVKKMTKIPKLRSLLAKEVVELGPRFTLNDWDLIARRANEYLLQEGLWHSHFCIYDGEECRRYFKGQVYLPYVSESSEDQNEQLAARIYEKSYEGYWKSQELAKTTTSGESYQNLPKDIFHFSFVYDLAYGAKLALKALPFCSLLLIVSGLKIDPQGVAMASVLSFLQLITPCYLDARRERKMTISSPVHVLTLFKLELQLEPGESASEWDKIAKKMNCYLRDKCRFRGRKVFFDGKQCHANFDSLLALTLPDGGIKKSRYPELVCFANECRSTPFP
ncbi:LAME_0C00958g1_1 [Lachancea meyersii CBS 8951]|uniref:LAME_0C00958g1_1 n=1 Tax=Lachancea meyersii CBS 8951 TaxID=1266667 RepID=A0A1G4IZI4_9SACH|nr:LAME_0C00958g1_1 [Lachancea meyersii CBS 8951]